MKLGYHKGTKLTEPDFSGKFLFWVFGAKRVQKWPKIVFVVFLKIASLLFSDFGPELEKFGSYKIASVRLSVCQQRTFLRIGSNDFSDFLHDVRGP